MKFSLTGDLAEILPEVYAEFKDNFRVDLD